MCWSMSAAYAWCSGAYDGLMMDCLWENEPDQQDVNGDGVHDQRDTQAWQEGMLFLLRNLREQYPDAILTGNGGGPWSDDCPYFQFANGCMHENALGDQFGGVAVAEPVGRLSSHRGQSHGARTIPSDGGRCASRPPNAISGQTGCGV